jgi:hypothetical protein
MGDWAVPTAQRSLVLPRVGDPSFIATKQSAFTGCRWIFTCITGTSRMTDLDSFGGKSAECTNTS